MGKSVADFDRTVESLRKLLDTGRQYWLFGAGISYGANIPLMYPLTARVKAMLGGTQLEIFNDIVSQLPDGCHVEHILSHIGDLIALASRVKSMSAPLGAGVRTVDELVEAHREIISSIAITVRYGYRPPKAPDAEVVGAQGNSIVKIDDHLDFVQTLFATRANLEARSDISFFTTNYDTLLEDALCLARRVPVDGFSGSAIGFWDPEAAEKHKATNYSHIYKLHGSVDWVLDPDWGLMRCRYDVKYLSTTNNVLIYPQATKYVETQKDPFAHQFSSFRRALASPQSHVLAVCGYSFGDNHINNEIDAALKSMSRKTNLIAFVKETANPEGAAKLPELLQEWTSNAAINARVYIATDKALYWNGGRYEATSGADLNWWSFTGMTKFLRDGSF